MTSITKLYCDRCGHEIPNRREKKIDRFDFCDCCYQSFQLWKSNQLNRNLKDAAEDDDDDGEGFTDPARCGICGRDKTDIPDIREGMWGWGTFQSFTGNFIKCVTVCPICAERVGEFMEDMSRHEEGSE